MEDFFGLKSGEKIVKWLLIAAAIIVAVIAIKKLIKELVPNKEGNQPVNKDNLSPTKNYSAFALAVHRAFDKWGFNDEEDMERVGTSLIELNDDELREVNNRYFQEYGEGKRTLYAALNDYLVCWPCTNLNAAIERVKNAGIV